MTSTRRRFAGATSFSWKRWLSHLSARGPSGILASSSPITVHPPSLASAHQADLDGDGHADVPGRHDDGETDREVPAPQVEARVVPPHALEQAPPAVEEVNAERDARGDVRQRHGYPLERGDRVPVHLAPHVPRVRGAPGEVEDVEHEEQSDDDAGPAHRAGREVRCHVVAL